jgi:hypothetical protein
VLRPQKAKLAKNKKVGTHGINPGRGNGGDEATNVKSGKRGTTGSWRERSNPSPDVDERRERTIGE